MSMIDPVRKFTWLLLSLCLALAAPVSAADDPLVKAATDGDAAAAQTLLAAGADPNSHDGDGLTALNWAAFKGHAAVVRLLLANHADADSHANPKFWTPLMNAAHGGFDDVVTLLLTAGADVNARSVEGYTPLWYAKNAKKPTTIALLRAHKGTDTAPVAAPQRLCDAAKATLAPGEEKALVWSAYDDKTSFGCAATKHAFPGGAGNVIMFNFQVDGDKTGARSLSIVADIYAGEMPKSTVNETLQPLLRDLFAKLDRGAVPADLTQAMTTLADLNTDTSLGRVTARLKLGDNPQMPNNGAKYSLTVMLK